MAFSFTPFKARIHVNQSVFFLIGNFDIRFPDIPFLAVNISYIAPLDTFVLSMWIRVNTSRGENATIFELDSERGTVLKLTRVGLGYDFEFMLKTYSNSTVKL